MHSSTGRVLKILPRQSLKIKNLYLFQQSFLHHPHQTLESHFLSLLQLVCQAHQLTILVITLSLHKHNLPLLAPSLQPQLLLLHQIAGTLPQ
jgi:hypothetical protein